MSRLWPADYGTPSASDIDAVAYASGGGFRSEAVDFEPVEDDQVVYARSISGPMSGLVTPPRCRQGHLLSVCECPWLERNKKTGADW